jgi:hypothetical protein
MNCAIRKICLEKESREEKKRKEREEEKLKQKR